MKKTWIRIMLLAVILLVLNGCAAPAEEMAAAEEDEGGENMQSQVDPYRAEGTQLDRRPQQTALATFALG
jgi:outer membrane biogenesis lipoprotein LolB